LAAHALAESGSEEAVQAACEWLKPKQILDVVGDWADNTPGTAPGGWAFQYNNAHYPDVDDTAVVGMLLHRSKDPTYEDSIERARQWILGMQSTNGGWGAFDLNNDREYLNHIPFADHGALLDPPTEDVTARCISFLAQLENEADRPAIDRGIAYLRKTQMPDGSWFGRWGTNYLYGTWSVLCALNAAGIPATDPMVKRATDWLISKQREDGGWGQRPARRVHRKPAQPIRLGDFGPDGGRHGRSSSGQTGCGLSAGGPGRGRQLDRAAL
jgi:squalene-hopene/tetraprenyl-beta-curcumene cyclase